MPSRACSALVLLPPAHLRPLVAVLDAWGRGVPQTVRTEETGETETPNRDRQRQTETHMDTWGPSKAPWASVSIIAGPIRAPLSSLMGMWHWLIDAAWHDLTLRHNRRHVWSHRGPEWTASIVWGAVGSPMATVVKCIEQQTTLGLPMGSVRDQ